MSGDKAWAAYPATQLLRSVERVTLTRVTIAEGTGTSDNPVRLVTYWLDDDGQIIARHDPAVSAAVAA